MKNNSTFSRLQGGERPLPCPNKRDLRYGLAYSTAGFGLLLIILGVVALVVGHYDMPNDSVMQLLSDLSWAQSPPNIWVPVVSHFGIGVVLIILGDDWVRRLKDADQAEKQRRYFQSKNA